MLPANAYVIRRATDEDKWALRALAHLDSQRPISEPALIGEIDGCPAAAISLVDGRVLADPFQYTVQLRQVLRIRAAAMLAHARTPSLPERLREAIATVPTARASEA